MNQCPICKKDNLCDVNNKKGCWCMTADISEELLMKVPDDQTGMACVCQSCVNKFNFNLAKEIKNDKPKS